MSEERKCPKCGRPVSAPCGDPGDCPLVASETWKDYMKRMESRIQHEAINPPNHFSSDGG